VGDVCPRCRALLRSSLPRWAGATVPSTVSGRQQGRLAWAAGTDLVIDYRSEEVVAPVRETGLDGVDVVVEFAPNTNGAIIAQVVAPGATISLYAQEGPDQLHVLLRPHMSAGTACRVCSSTR
jgi:NADPH:quinone reductase